MKNTLIALVAIVLIVGVYVAFSQRVEAPTEPNDTGRIRAPEEAVLSVGQTATLAGVSVTPNKVNDSRCPADVQCVWAGTVTASVLLELNGETQTVDIGLDVEPVEFGGYLVSLVSVEPTRGSGPSLEQDTYRLTIRVAPVVGSDGNIPANI